MPEQLPISPPYKTACQLKKQNMLDKASYSSYQATASAVPTDIFSKEQTNTSDDLKVEQLTLDDPVRTTTTTTEKVSSDI